MNLPRFYLLASDAAQVEQYAPLGVGIIQLRYKGDDPRQHVQRAVEIGHSLGTQIVINDHWREAIECGAPWVHLGQEDLDDADVEALRKAGIKIGVSTHDRAELRRALDMGADYVALGPVWATLLKKMKWRPQGLEKLARWKEFVGPTPLVAIGGITPERAPLAFQAGADSVAVVTDVAQAADPAARIREWLDVTKIGSATVKDAGEAGRSVEAKSV